VAYFADRRESGFHLFHLGQAAMLMKGTIDSFAETALNYLTLAECYKMAAFNGLKKLK
jgi:NAD(P) transhydrogenase